MAFLAPFHNLKGAEKAQNEASVGEVVKDATPLFRDFHEFADSSCGTF